jgi:hypothetical protein
VRFLITITLVVALALVGCGGDDKKGAGEPCTPTPAGATECESAVCLEDISCGGKVVPTACAGTACDPSVSPHDCGADMQCVPVTGTALGYCLPTTLCQ